MIVDHCPAKNCKIHHSVTFKILNALSVFWVWRKVVNRNGDQFSLVFVVAEEQLPEPVFGAAAPLVLVDIKKTPPHHTDIGLVFQKRQRSIKIGFGAKKEVIVTQEEIGLRHQINGSVARRADAYVKLHPDHFTVMPRIIVPHFVRRFRLVRNIDRHIREVFSNRINQPLNRMRTAKGGKNHCKVLRTNRRLRPLFTRHYRPPKRLEAARK
nr:hypothetical protein [Pseudophaeobacter arcticus]